MRKKQAAGKPVAWLLAGVLLLLTTSPVAAEQDPGSDKWRFGGEVYLWGAGIGATTVTGDDIDITFSDIMKNLDIALMGTLAARRDKWTLFADIIYLDVSADDKSTANIIGRPVKTKVEVGLKGFITTLAGAYTVMETDATRLDLLGGARHFSLDADLKFDIGRTKEMYSDSDHVWDGIIGIRGDTKLNEKWYLTYYLDAGTGDTDLTWQARTGISYKFEKADVHFGYRYLEWDFDDNNDTFDDLNISGPFVGVRFRF
jgi:hypothetical protein